MNDFYLRKSWFSFAFLCFLGIFPSNISAGLIKKSISFDEKNYTVIYEETDDSNNVNSSIIINAYINGKPFWFSLYKMNGSTRGLPPDTIGKDGISEAYYNGGEKLWLVSRLGPKASIAILIDINKQKIEKSFAGNDFIFNQRKDHVLGLTHTPSTQLIHCDGILVYPRSKDTLNFSSSIPGVLERENIFQGYDVNNMSDLLEISWINNTSFRFKIKEYESNSHFQIESRKIDKKVTIQKTDSTMIEFLFDDNAKSLDKRQDFPAVNSLKVLPVTSIDHQEILKNESQIKRLQAEMKPKCTLTTSLLIKWLFIVSGRC